MRTEDVVARRGGALRHLGRADDLFKVDGCLVSPGDIESALAEHPRVAEAAVVGAPQGGRLVRPAAFVVPTGDAGARPALARELRRHVARRLAPALAPARVVLTDALPRLARASWTAARCARPPDPPTLGASRDRRRQPVGRSVPFRHLRPLRSDR